MLIKNYEKIEAIFLSQLDSFYIYMSVCSFKIHKLFPTSSNVPSNITNNKLIWQLTHVFVDVSEKSALSILQYKILTFF